MALHDGLPFSMCTAVPLDMGMPYAAIACFKANYRTLKACTSSRSMRPARSSSPKAVRQRKGARRIGAGLQAMQNAACYECLRRRRYATASAPAPAASAANATAAPAVSPVAGREDADDAGALPAVSAFSVELDGPDVLVPVVSEVVCGVAASSLSVTESTPASLVTLGKNAVTSLPAASKMAYEAMVLSELPTSV